MTTDMTFRTEKFLSAAIFVLWSLGVVVIPALRSSIDLQAMFSIRILYLLLQIVLLVFSLYLLGSITAVAMHAKRIRSNMIWRALLYMYVVATLVASIGFGIGMLAIGGL